MNTLPASTDVPHLDAWWPRHQEGLSGLLELELLMVESCHETWMLGIESTFGRAVPALRC